MSIQWYFRFILHPTSFKKYYNGHKFPVQNILEIAKETKIDQIKVDNWITNEIQRLSRQYRKQTQSGLNNRTSPTVQNQSTINNAPNRVKESFNNEQNAKSSVSKSTNCD